MAIMRTPLVLVFAIVGLVACGKKKEDPAPGPPTTVPPSTATPPATAAAPVEPAKVPAGDPPPDGKYERVTIDGVTVPMVQVMNGGKVILVDTDGVKPRSWEEQYKRKRELPNGQYDLHKTNTNKNDTFEDDAIDKEGLWVIDAKGNITKR